MPRLTLNFLRYFALLQQPEQAGVSSPHFLLGPLLADALEQGWGTPNSVHCQ